MFYKVLGSGGEHRLEHSWAGDWHRGPPGWCRRLGGRGKLEKWGQVVVARRAVVVFQGE